jgi:exo-beta-1,3-glucanase (GH17 family)/cellulose synthase/poly-beta-1,6-N-acetylglucosamine synthase-like glycosyltransferase
MNRSNFLIAIAITMISILFWAMLNRPEQAPPWPKQIQGFSFSPMRENHNPINHILPNAEEIEEDLALLANTTHAVRTYMLDGDMVQVPALAQKYNLNVTLGAWLNADPKANEIEVKKLIKTTQDNYRNVVRVVVGNESILRGELTVKQVGEYLDQVRDALNVPVSTAETWDVWLAHPELAEHVDYVAVHILPYWDGVELDQAVDHVVLTMNKLKNKFPGKEVIIGEVGWPSNARTHKLSVASPANQATFLRRFLHQAEQKKYVYYIMEAFDQPWKRISEGSVGAYWGVYDVQRHPKFAFSAPIVGIPEWRTLAAISIVIGIITFTMLLIDSKTLQNRGRSFLAIVAFFAATAAVWIIYTYYHQYMTISAIIVGILMIIGIIGVSLVLLAEAHEWAEAIWLQKWRRSFTPIELTDEELPIVSVHVPAYNEPPEMMIETLNALARLDYPHYEVIIIDNNTKDPAIWQPVEAHCAALNSALDVTASPRFRFFHQDPLPGFKAGALNFALAQTAPETVVIAVIDSDYQVSPRWLRDLTPQFARLEVAIVQAPQDYHDDKENLFKAMCYAEYRGFFYIGMQTRNERNAIIQHGTMTMVRKSALEEVNGWSEWCITEDAELGLKIFEKGYEATYIAKSYGQGVMPDTFIDFKKQRFRWAYGAVQVMRHHFGILFLGSGKTKLTTGQRYHFVAGWLPWMADSLNMLFTLAAIGWSIAMIVNPLKFDPPMVMLSSLPLMLFSFKMAKMIHLYRIRVGASITETAASALAGLSLSHTISMAILQGVFTRSKPFFRTPKMEQAHALRRALLSAREEGLIMVALWASAYGVTVKQGVENSDLMVWIVVLLILSIPYMAAVFVSLISGFSRLPSSLIANRKKVE